MYLYYFKNKEKIQNEITNELLHCKNAQLGFKNRKQPAQVRMREGLQCYRLNQSSAFLFR